MAPEPLAKSIITSEFFAYFNSGPDIRRYFILGEVRTTGVRIPNMKNEENLRVR